MLQSEPIDMMTESQGKHGQILNLIHYFPESYGTLTGTKDCTCSRRTFRRTRVADDAVIEGLPKQVDVSLRNESIHHIDGLQP